MAHTLEPASSGRAKCRGCGELIRKGELRFGERLPNPFADGDMTIWFHPLCAAYRRPDSVAATLPELDADVYTQQPGLRDNLEQAVQMSLQHHRAARLGRAERASSGRAKCRHCRETIEKDSWRLPLMFFEEGIFNRSGFIHAACSRDYVDGAHVIPLILHFADNTTAAEQAELQLALTG